MNKKFFILIIITVLLVVGIVVKNKSRKKITIIDEVSATKMLDRNFLTSDITSITMYDGKHSDKKVKLSNKNGNWSVVSSYGVRAKEAKIIEFFDVFKKIVGELRSSNKNHHKSYSVTDNTAFHLEINRADKQDFFLIGKGLDNESCFIRNAKNDYVYRVGGEIRSRLDLAEKTNTLRKDTWIQKELLDLDTAKMNKLVVTYPDKKLLFARVEIRKNNVKKASKKKYYQWELIEGDFGRDFKQEGLRSFLDGIATCKVSNVVDPENRKKYGLDNPNFRIEISLETGIQKILVASYNLKEKKGYGYIDDKPELIYELGEWVFSNIFKKGSDVFSLAGINLKKEEIASIKIVAPKQNISLTQKEKKWNLVSAQKLNKETMADIINTISSLSPKDYTTINDENILDLANPTYMLTVTLRNGNNHRIYSSAKKSPVIDGFYIGIDKNKPHVVISSDDFHKLFPVFAQ